MDPLVHAATLWVRALAEHLAYPPPILGGTTRGARGTTQGTQVVAKRSISGRKWPAVPSESCALQSAKGMNTPVGALGPRAWPTAVCIAYAHRTRCVLAAPSSGSVSGCFHPFRAHSGPWGSPGGPWALSDPKMATDQGQWSPTLRADVVRLGRRSALGRHCPHGGSRPPVVRVGPAGAPCGPGWGRFEHSHKPTALQGVLVPKPFGLHGAEYGGGGYLPPLVEVYPDRRTGGIGFESTRRVLFCLLRFACCVLAIAAG